MDVGITWYTEKHDAEDTAEEIRSHGRRAVLAQLDVGEPDAVGDVVDQLIDDLGGVDVFVNNAGMGITTPFWRRSSTTGGESWRSIWTGRSSACSGRRPPWSSRAAAAG